MHDYPEDALVEQSAIALLRDAQEWEALNCCDEPRGQRQPNGRGLGEGRAH
jgi:hypothetical protein